MLLIIHTTCFDYFVEHETITYYVISMLDIRIEIKSLIARKCTSMNKVVNALREAGIFTTSPSNISTKFKNKTIKFDEVLHILDQLGYKIKIEEK